MSTSWCSTCAGFASILQHASQTHTARASLGASALTTKSESADLKPKSTDLKSESADLKPKSTDLKSESADIKSEDYSVHTGGQRGGGGGGGGFLHAVHLDDAEVTSKTPVRRKRPVPYDWGMSRETNRFMNRIFR